VTGRFAVPLLLFAVVAAPARSAGADPPGSLAACEEQARRVPDSPDSYRCFRTVARGQDLWNEAATRLEALLLVNPRNDLARLALAGLESQRGGDRAEPLYREAVEGLAEAGRSDAEILGRLELSMFLAIRGRLDVAGVEIERAAEVAERVDSPLARARVDTHRGFQAYRVAQYDRAERLLNSVEETIRLDGTLYDRSTWLSGMGATYWAMGRFPEALSLYRRQAELLREAGDPYEEASARSNVALLTNFTMPPPWSAEDRQRIVELVQESLAVARTGGNLTIVAKSYLYLAQLTESVDEKRGHLANALEVYRGKPVFEDQLLAMRLLSESLLEQEPRDPEGGLELLDEAEHLARSHGNLQHVVRARTMRAGLEWARGRTTGWREGSRSRSIAASLAAMDAIEDLRDHQSDAMVRARTFSRWAWIYYQLVGNLLWPPEVSPSPEDADLAFRVSERMRARIFLDELDAARVSTLLQGDSAVATERARILNEIAAHNKALMNPSLAEGERSGLLDELERLEIEEAALRAALAESSPVMMLLRSPAPPATHEVREALGDDEAMLAFVVANVEPSEFQGGSWLWVLTRNAVDVIPLPERRELEGSIRLLLGLLQNRDGSELPGTTRLYRDLLAAPLETVGPDVTKLIVVPDGPLHRLPFGALRAEIDEEPVGVRYRITLTPSASAWLHWRRAKRLPAGRPALALIDPENASAAESPMEGSEPSRGGGTFGGASLGRLPSAHREGDAVTRHFGWRSEVRVGANASERVIKESDLERFGWVHLAAHAIVDDQRPERSGVLLAPGAEEEDGLLQMREVVDLDLTGRVAVLSTCRSASGAELEGEGVIGLARAFFVAGAHAVVGSLWPVRDDDSAALFEDFYRHLGEGQSLGQALLAARRDRLAAGAPTIAWAGVVLFGNGDLVPLPGGGSGSRWQWWHVALVTALLAVAAAGRGAMLYRHRQTSRSGTK
jgi:CHAT domain-containing protein/tetratricopeptide (TPR) repeat protein